MGISKKLREASKKKKNKNGVLWSQARMRIEMLFGHLVIGNVEFEISIWQQVIGSWQ